MTQDGIYYADIPVSTAISLIISIGVRMTIGFISIPEDDEDDAY